MITTFQPKSGGLAFLETLYRIKFSKHTPLVVVLLSMVYTVYRTNHYMSNTFNLAPLVSWPTAMFLELSILAAAASVFIALRGAYVAELKQEDAQRARVGIWLSMAALIFAFGALIGVAWADAWALTKQEAPAAIMVLVQVTQMIFICCFILVADLEERESLRTQYADFSRNQTAKSANECPYCHKPVAPNNRARHVNSCPLRPESEA